MWRDPIVEEVRAAREAYARRFGYDLKKIAKDLNAKTLASAKPAKKSKTTASGTASKSTRKTKRSAA